MLSTNIALNEVQMCKGTVKYQACSDLACSDATRKTKQLWSKRWSAACAR